MEFLFTGMAVPAADAASQQTSSISAFVVLETTSELKISLGREVAVAH